MKKPRRTIFLSRHSLDKILDWPYCKYPKGWRPVW